MKEMNATFIASYSILLNAPTGPGLTDDFLLGFGGDISIALEILVVAVFTAADSALLFLFFFRFF